MMKIRKGDTVRVIAGKDKDKEGKVLAVKDGKVLVEGVGMVTKLSNVMYLHNGKPTRIGFKMDGDKKVRVAKTSGDIIG